MATEMSADADDDRQQPQEPTTPAPDRIELPEDWACELDDWPLEEAGYGHGV